MVAATPDPAQAPRSGLALGVAGLAAVLASGCCVAPLVLALVGISGAWISQLRRLEPYSPWLLTLALASLSVAAWRLYRRPLAGGSACEVGDVACRRVNRTARRWFWVVAVMTLIPILLPGEAPWFY